MAPLLITIPHSGEKVPPEAKWLQNIDPLILMCDVDRFVDRMYLAVIKELDIPCVISEWHRYSGDLNRLPEDVDETTVKDAIHPAGKFNRGFLWAITTKNHKLMDSPVSQSELQVLIKKYYEPFHRAIAEKISLIKKQHSVIYHIDAHSMPSVGTKEHRDPGEKRADFVISDAKGTSADASFKDLVIKAYQDQGFSVSYNWPYYGGRLTEMYGKPAVHHHCVQVEMNRALYMNEETKQWEKDKAEATQKKVSQAIRFIYQELKASV